VLNVKLLQMDQKHGNECVPTLIGAQGCGKTTFVQRLLPPQLRSDRSTKIHLGLAMKELGIEHQQ
jgi:ABC-type phosphate transport system ATPase subunit